MKRLLALAILLGTLVSPLPGEETPTQEEINKAKFEAYIARRKARKAYALQLRRAYNSTKVHVYRTGYVIPISVMGVPAIQQGWVRQPPITRYRRRPAVIVVPCDRYYE